jgi:hypothetical protein
MPPEDISIEGDPRQDAMAILAWIATSIAAHGGTGRRLGRLIWQGPVPHDDRFKAAVNYIVDNRLGWLDHESGAPFGWIYLIPGPPPEES